MTPVSAPLMDDVNDTEITLGTGKMLVLFFLLVIVCAVFFGMGYSMGRNSVKSAPELLASPSPSTVRSSPSNQSDTGPVAAQQAPVQQAPATPTDSGSAGDSATAPAASPAPDQGTASPPPMPSMSPGYFVQVAAVSKQEDAQALVEALKAKQYSAIIASPTSDKLFHVQVGPFTDIKDAEGMRAKLVSDGYNPILKK